MNKKEYQKFKFRIIKKPDVRTIAMHRKEKNKNVINIVIDEKVPKKFVKPFCWHEKREDYKERVEHKPYKKAHLETTHEEHKKFFAHKPKEWKKDLAFSQNLFAYRKRKKEGRI